MRNALTTMVGMAFFLTAACGSGTSSTTGGTSNGTGNTGASTGGLLANGAPCANADQCLSSVCETNCCAATCPNEGTNACSQPTGCDDGGLCAYPVKGTDCGTTCSGNMYRKNTCDGAGGCSGGTAGPCDAGYSCGATACNTSCGADGGCAYGYYCAGIGSGGQGTCAQQAQAGPCTENAECLSGECGGLSSTNTSGFCCGLPCPHDEYPECVATSCTADSGACVYPRAGTICDKANEACTGSTLSAGTCDGTGNCDLGNTPCPGNYVCSQLASQGCITSCLSDLDCADAFYCDTVKGSKNQNDCLPEQADGGCSGNDQCLSGICGVNGTGHCCVSQCAPGGAPCGAPDCDGTTGLCDYADAGTVCGSTPESCDAGIQQNPSVCDGKGACPTPATVNCAPYACSTISCFSTCTSNASCGLNDFCDATASVCCNGPLSGQRIAVDSAVGADGACCGIGGAVPCQTITYAMKLIDAAQATGVTIDASVLHNAGTWAPAAEVYPIVLGWGVELNASGVAFWDPKAAGNEVFDIAPFSANDTVGYASLVGNPGPVYVGMDLKNTNQTSDPSAIQVESGNTLYLGNAVVNGNSTLKTTAITVIAGGTLTLGQDHALALGGTVTIGNNTNAKGFNGWSGIVCGAKGATTTCTVNDNAAAGKTSLVIEDQEAVDIDAEDSASITLTGNPVIGIAPMVPGFGSCKVKVDGDNGPAAVLLRGSANVSLTNATVQCIYSDAFLLEASTLTPTLTLDSTTIQNSEQAIIATAGSATISNSTIEFNYNGIQQATDGTNISAINLSGGGNTVICSSEVESVIKNQPTPGVDVLNATSQALNASNVAWDTSGPDVFKCNPALTTCLCENNTCTNGAGDDSMDAVYDSTGLITTTGSTRSMTMAAIRCN